MKDYSEHEKAISFLLWGDKGYQRDKDTSSQEFSIEKMLDFLEHKRESEKDDDIERKISEGDFP
jgi:hypothetical protein